MNTPNDGGPAFPLQIHPSPNCEIHEGMSLRDWFAGLAMQAILTVNPQNVPGMTESNVDQLVAREAYASADAMLAQRTKQL